MQSCIVAMAKCYWGIQILVILLFLFCSGIAEPLRCTFPKDFSHRAKSAELWIQSREKRPVLDNWDRKQWSTIHKRLDARANSSAWDVFQSEANLDEFMSWTFQNARSQTSSRRFTVAPVEKPWWRADGSQVLTSFATEDLKQGETVLDLPVRFFLSNIWETGDPTSLYTDGTPWEVQLAAKLLRERSKGLQSRWKSYIKLLPRFIPLPIFFSELEVNNIQDKTTQDEVERMRNFAKSTFQSLRIDEIAGVKFGDYVWALSVVYSSSCQLDVITQRKSAPIASHYMVPFFSADSEVSTIYAEYVDEGLKLIAYDVKQGTPLTAQYVSTTFRDSFLFHGFVPKIGQQDKITVFNGLQDLVDWYSSRHGGVNKNRYLTLKLAQDAMNTIAASLEEFDTPSNDGLKHRSGDFSVGAGGYVDVYMISIFATLYYAEDAISGKPEIGTFTTVDFIVRTGTSAWERIMKDIALASISRYGSNALLDCNTTQASHFQPGFSSAKMLIQDRLTTFLDSFSTSVVEDMALLAAAEWEGMNEFEGDELGCPTCRWQTEQMSYHDNLAVQFRASLKSFTARTISELGCGASVKNNSAQIKGVTSKAGESLESLQEFLKWCEGHNLIISKKLAITEIMIPTNDQAHEVRSYRGVVAVEDIPPGETLCTLPMSVGLFNNDSGSTSEVDTWDLAAARLLREKAKGDDSNYAPYIAILPDYLPTPIHLDTQEIMEVQWMPMVRELVQVRKAIKESFGRLDQQELAWATFEEYEWAVTMVHSRAFTLPVRGDDKYELYVLMPFMDMINHHYYYQADWVSQEIWDSKLDITSRRGLRKGEELFASFGPRSNDNLFLYYGFLLQENPFDSAPIFGSFEEALKWFLDLWTQNCIEFSAHSVEALCRQRNWQLHWHRMKDAMEVIERGSSASGGDWVELLGYWADLGFQFLPYQPGPTIYPKGVIDPSLLAAFSTFYEVIVNVTKDGEGFSPSPDPCCGKSTALGSEEMRTFFACLESQGTSPQGLLDGHVCQSALDEVLRIEKTLERGMLLARISVALRCSEILASFPTTLDHDRKLVTASSEDCSIENSLACRSRQAPSRHLQLTWQYRYIKKLLLQAPIDNALKL
ncbi:unnamed protein product [Calypogeia fissa]